eukprot:366052-Chlamydomonas_euryale.AAC.24
MKRSGWLQPAHLCGTPSRWLWFMEPVNLPAVAGAGKLSLELVDLHSRGVWAWPASRRQSCRAFSMVATDVRRCLMRPGKRSPGAPLHGRVSPAPFYFPALHPPRLMPVCVAAYLQLARCIVACSCGAVVNAVCVGMCACCAAVTAELLWACALAVQL